MDYQKAAPFSSWSNHRRLQHYKEHLRSGLIAKVAVAAAKSDWSKYILPASLAAGAYTAAAPIEGLDDTQGEWDEEKG